MIDRALLLAAYDHELRADAETAGAVSATRLGPLLLVTFESGHGFITYRDLGGVDAEGIQPLVERALAHFQRNFSIGEVEWKTRSHDHAPGLPAALVAAGFAPDEPESIMIGDAHRLATETPPPDGVTLRRVRDETDVRAMCAMQDEVFDSSFADAMVPELLRRLAADDGIELWVAEAAGRIVSAGRLDPVPGTRFAGIWGGATRAEWRHRGIYRALTTARARSALRLGKTLLHSDSTEFSRPILERSGLVKVSSTTPYHWHR